MALEWFPVLTRLMVTKPSLSLKVAFPVSNSMETVGAVVDKQKTKIAINPQTLSYKITFSN